MSPLTNLRIDAAISGREDAFAEILAARTAREQHWSGAAGKGGNVQPSSWLDAHGERIVINALEAGIEPADFRRMAARLRAARPGDPAVVEFADYMESAASEAEERFAEHTAEEAGREMASMNAMESFLREHGVPMVEQRTAIGNADSKQQHPRQYGWANFPTNVRPQTIDDREARGARPGDLPLSARILDAAREMAQLANATKDTRQRNRIAKYASYLRQAYARQLEREDASEVAAADDDANAEVDKLVNDAARDAAKGSGDGDGDHAEFRSFDSWDDEPRQGSDAAIADDVALQLDEDVPTMPDVPRAGRRFGEDQVPPENIRDEPQGLRRNIHDDNILQRLKKGSARFGAGQPRGGDRFGGERKRYSAEAMREADARSNAMTAELLFDQEAYYFATHSTPRG